MTDTGAVLAALATVRDPELDEPVTELGFVSSCTVSTDGHALVRLRLPTYFCAPNFAFLMVADAQDAVSAVPGVSRAEVVLEDHFAADAINAGVAARSGFAESFARAGRRRAGRAADRLRAQGGAGRHGPGLPPAAGPGRRPSTSWPSSPWATCLHRRTCERLRARRAELGLPAR